MAQARTVFQHGDLERAASRSCAGARSGAAADLCEAHPHNQRRGAPKNLANPMSQAVVGASADRLSTRAAQWGIDVRVLSASLVLIAISQPAVARDVSTWDNAGGLARDALIVAAVGIPAAKGDWSGEWQAAGSLGATALLTYGLKESLPELRPDRSDRRSFPSGHAAISFAAAASLQNRYGWRIGVPAQLVAAFVGVSRVEARKHHWYDVAAGAALGEATGFLLTRKRDAAVQIFPWAGSDGAGAVAMIRF